MAQWPPSPIAAIPSSGVTWPERVEVSPIVLVGPTAENQQPGVLDTRTESLRALLNTLVGMTNVVRQHFLDRDGDDAAIDGSVQGPVYMEGDFDMGGLKIVNLADGIALTDAVTQDQLEAIQFSAQDDVEQVLNTRVVFQDGTAAMIATLDTGANRIIALDTALVSTDANRKDYSDTEVTTLEATLLKRIGTPPMTGDFDFDGVLPVDPGFTLTNLGDPISTGDMVNKRFLDTQVAVTATEDVPIAALISFMGPASAIPANFLLCDGREVSRFTFQNLFNIIGIAFGPPSSGSVFKLPDLRGRAALPIDNMGGQLAGHVTPVFARTLGGQGGEEDVALTLTSLATHTHGKTDITYAGGVGVEQGDSGASDADNQHTSVSRSSQLEGGGLAHNNVQPSMAVNWLIRS